MIILWAWMIICQNFMCMDDYFILGRFIKIIQIYVNLCKFMANKWCFNNKNVFNTIEEYR